MKKTLVLLCVLLAMALPLMAAPIIAGTEGASELTWGFITDGTDVKTRWTNLIYTQVVQVDPSNYILWGITGGNNPDLSSFKLRAFSGNMILDTVLGLPKEVTVKLKFGLDDITAYNAPPSGYAYENTMGYDPGPRPTIGMLATVYGVNARIAWNPGMSADYASFGIAPQKASLLANVYGNVGPLLLSVAYNQGTQTIDKGNIGTEVQYNGAIGPVNLTVDVEGNYNLATPDSSLVGIAWAINTSFIPWLTIDASTNVGKVTPNNTQGFNYVGIGVEARPDPEKKRIGASLGLDFNLDPTVSDPIRSIDGSVWFKALGPGKIRVGYLYTHTRNGGGDYYAPASLQNGGAYFKYDMSW